MGMRIPGRILLSSLLPAVLSYGQNIAGTITGVVEDPSGARIIGATITAVNQDTNVRYPAIITEAGAYVIPEALVRVSRDKVFCYLEASLRDLDGYSSRALGAQGR
jgi:hypothetical protein